MEFIPDFGKYSFFVLTSYGVSIATLLALIFLTFSQNRKHR